MSDQQNANATIRGRIPFDASKAVIYPENPYAPPPMGSAAIYELPNGDWHRVKAELPDGRLETNRITPLEAKQFLLDAGRPVPMHLQLIEERNQLIGSSRANRTANDRRGEAENRPVHPTSPHEEGPPPVILRDRGECPVVNGVGKTPLSDAQFDAVAALLKAGSNGYTKDQLDRVSGRTETRKILSRLAANDADWASVIQMAGKSGRGYRIVKNAVSTRAHPSPRNRPRRLAQM